jgi:hypothetical protein
VEKATGKSVSSPEESEEEEEEESSEEWAVYKKFPK